MERKPLKTPANPRKYRHSADQPTPPLEEPIAHKFQPMASYIKGNGHLRIADPDTKEVMRIIPEPYPKPTKINLTWENGNGQEGGGVGYQFSEEVRQEVCIMIAGGFAIGRIATAIHVDVDTLRRHFAEEIENGPTLANYALVRSLYMRACRGDIGAAVWWTKNRMGWREPENQVAVDVKMTTIDLLRIAVPKIPPAITNIINVAPGAVALFAPPALPTNEPAPAPLESNVERTP